MRVVQNYQPKAKTTFWNENVLYGHHNMKVQEHRRPRPHPHALVRAVFLVSWTASSEGGPRWLPCCPLPQTSPP